MLSGRPGGPSSEDRILLSLLKPREPFCGLSHFAGALLSTAGLIVLLALSQDKPWHLTSFAIYGASLILLYTASTLYHSLPGTPRKIERLRTFDQVAIYLLIAGTYTPVCLVALRGPWGYSLLSVMWTIAIAGSVARVGWRSKPEWLTFSLYLLMGWACAIAIIPLARALGPIGIAWLSLGGILYTVGAVVLATDRPRLWPGRFGSHDLWHCFVLGGSACHFAMMVFAVAPRP